MRENIRSSRRNIIRMGAVVAAAVVAKTTSAAADRRRWDDDDWHWHHHHHHHEDRDQKERHCFLKGTAIRTVQGDKKIEDLAAGELLPTVFGGEVPIKSITRRRFGMAVR